MSKAALSIAARIMAVIGEQPVTAKAIARAAVIVAQEDNAARLANRRAI